MNQDAKENYARKNFAFIRGDYHPPFSVLEKASASAGDRTSLVSDPTQVHSLFKQEWLTIFDQHSQLDLDAAVRIFLEKYGDFIPHVPCELGLICGLGLWRK